MCRGFFPRFTWNEVRLLTNLESGTLSSSLGIRYVLSQTWNQVCTIHLESDTNNTLGIRYIQYTWNQVHLVPNLESGTRPVTTIWLLKCNKLPCSVQGMLIMMLICYVTSLGNSILWRNIFLIIRTEYGNYFLLQDRGCHSIVYGGCGGGGVQYGRWLDLIIWWQWGLWWWLYDDNDEFDDDYMMTIMMIDIWWRWWWLLYDDDDNDAQVAISLWHWRSAKQHVGMTQPAGHHHHCHL